jgi:hypothetical protein
VAVFPPPLSPCHVTGGEPFWRVILAATWGGGGGWLGLPFRGLSPNTGKYSFLPCSPYLHDFSLIFLMFYSLLDTALLLVLMQPSGDGYFRLCSSKSSFRGTQSLCCSIPIVPRIISGFIIKPRQTQQRKRKQGMSREKDRDKGDLGPMSCVHKPPLSPSSPPRNLPHLPVAMVIRTEEVSMAVSPPPPHSPLPNTQRPQRWTSMMSSIWRVWVQKLI